MYGGNNGHKTGQKNVCIIKEGRMMTGTSAFSLIVNAYIVKGNVDLQGSRLGFDWSVWPVPNLKMYMQ